MYSKFNVYKDFYNNEKMSRIWNSIEAAKSIFYFMHIIGFNSIIFKDSDSNYLAMLNSI